MVPTYWLNLIAAHEIASVAVADGGGDVVRAVAREVLTLYDRRVSIQQVEKQEALRTDEES